MLPDRVSNPGPLTYESDALPIALRGPADRGQTRGKPNMTDGLCRRQKISGLVYTLWCSNFQIPASNSFEEVVET